MTIARSALETVLAHARESKPRECCGILVGTSDDIQRAVRARNLADSPTRYELDPRDHLAAIHAVRSEGLEVVGFYHSHPHSDPWPSETDLAEAHDGRAVYLIVSLRGDRPLAKLFRLTAERAEEVELSISDPRRASQAGPE